MVGDLPDYEKKIIIVTPAGEYPAIVKIDLEQLLGDPIQNPTIANCLPISVENKAIAYDDVNDRFKTYIENKAIAYNDANDRFKVDIEAMTVGTITTDVSDKWTRQLGLIDISRVLGSALAHSNPVIVRLTNGSAFIDPTDVADRAARLLGKIYGDQGVLTQRATSLDLYTAIRYSGAEIDPRSIRALTNSDVVSVEQSDETKLKATVTQAAKDRTISSVDATGTAVQISIAGLNGNSSALATPSTGKKVRLKFISIQQDTDVDIGFRFSTTGTIYYMRITAGVWLANLMHTDIQGAANQSFYLYSSGATNVKGFFTWEDVS